MISLDLQQTFFSRHSSFLSFSVTDRGVPHGLYLRHLRGALVQPELFRLECVHNGITVPFTIEATPAKLTLQCTDATIAIAFSSPDDLRIIGKGATLRFIRDTAAGPYDCALPRGNGRWEINAYSSELKCLFTPEKGKILMEAPYDGMKAESLIVELAPIDGSFDVHLQTYRSTTSSPPSAMTFTETVAANEASFTAWHEQILPVPAQWAQARTLAAYLNWAGMVPAEGNLTRPAMFMSKNWMNKIWGWDNCFNAIAHVQQDPQLAWDQLMLFVDNQGPDGAFPDHITNTTCSFRFYKPPVYGWAIKQLQARSDWIDIDRLAEIYSPLCRWTEWWFSYRDDDQDGLPQYNHGNESGWDNGTLFAQFLPVESPDLATFLILQMDFLAETANLLNNHEDANMWRRRAAALLERLIEELWDGRQFIARHAHTHEPAPNQSLLLYMPLLLGDRLPEDMRTAMIDELRNFVTSYGLATENPDSPYYTPDGYWRGPIWAPSTYLIIDGLRRCGADGLAGELAYRFCELAARSGMAENYDALCGAGLRDRAYTWTSGVFLLLAADISESVP